MRICVEYEELCTDSHRGSGRWGSWRESFDSRVTDAFEVGEEDLPYDYSVQREYFVIPDGSTQAFVIYMIYETGDSFGHADGKIDIIHCTGDEDLAHRIAKTISDNKDEYSFKFTDDFGREISIDNRGAGYFERISYIEVLSFSIGPGRRKTRYH